MAPLASPTQNALSAKINQSHPVDPTAPYSPSTLANKTILLTGGASGLGAAFARRWAALGAHLVIGDIDVAAGEALVAELRAATADPHHHFVRVDVASWPAQVALFRAAARLSPSGAIDAVVASAGISDKDGATTGKGFENPAAAVGLDGPDDPPPPSLKCVEVNLLGTMYTAHLALFWLQQQRKKDDDDGDDDDRHLLLIGSSAGLYPLPGVPEYVTSKHGVTGLFRALRTLAWRQRIRVNMLCPYFVDTPILPNRAMAMLAGLGLARLDDTVDAATRLMACSGAGGEATRTRISGRALVVGPRVSLLRKVLPDREGIVGQEDGAVNGDGDGLGGDVLVSEDVRLGKGQAVWECYAHDYETVDYFMVRYIRLLNTIAAIKGWIGFFRDLFHALFVRKDPKSARARI